MKLGDKNKDLATPVSKLQHIKRKVSSYQYCQLVLVGGMNNPTLFRTCCFRFFFSHSEAHYQQKSFTCLNTSSTFLLNKSFLFSTSNQSCALKQPKHSSNSKYSSDSLSPCTAVVDINQVCDVTRKEDVNQFFSYPNNNHRTTNPLTFIMFSSKTK